ncbi:hypothetical protein [Microbulbifer sp. 2201CG32-9]|uniref:hypothetical protein n=1 Tax=unclassified Microbulbifer TaxID=2619833 RepID=UPI00345BEB67
MSVGSWEPKQTVTESGTAGDIKRELLLQFIDSVEAQSPLQETLDSDALQASHLIRLSASAWQKETARWDNSQLWRLIQFFTLAEQQLPGWDAGAESAVIPLARALRQRRAPLEREQLQWIKQHSSNRYLPYGPL